MLVIDVDVRVVEVWVALPVVGVGGLKGVRALVLVLHTVVVQPIRDETLALTFDYFVVERAKPLFARAPLPILRSFFFLAESRQVPTKHDTEQVPSAREAGVFGFQSIDDVLKAPEILAFIEPGGEGGARTRGLADDIQAKRMEGARAD